MSVQLPGGDRESLLQESATIDQEMAPVFCCCASGSITYLDEPLALFLIPSSLDDFAVILNEFLQVEFCCRIPEIL